VSSLKRQSFISSIFTYLGVLVGLVVTIFIQPQVLSETEIGILRVVTSYATLLLPFCNLGFVNAALRYFPYFRAEDDKHNGFLGLFLLVNFIGCIIASLILLFGKSYLVRPEELEVFSKYIGGIFVLFIGLSFFAVFDTYARLMFYSVVGRFLREFLTRFLVLLALVALLYLGLNFYQFFNFWLLANVLPLFILVAYLFRKMPLYFKPDLGFVDKPLRNSLTKASFFAILTGSSTVIIQHLDGVMIAKYLSLSENGIFSICMYVGVVISMPSRSVYSAVATQVGEDWKSGNHNNLSKMYRSSCLFLGLIGLLLFGLVWINVDTLFSVLPPSYSAGKYVIFFMGIGALIEMSTGINGVIITTSEHYKYDTYFLMSLILVTVLLNIYLIPIYRIVGVAVAYAITFGLFNIFRWLFVWYKFGFQPFDLQWLKTMGIVATVLLSILLVPKIQPVFTTYPIEDFVIRSVFFVVISGILLFYFKPSVILDEMVTKVLTIVKTKLGIS
jgi:O-antigen/teichoic acid export membrane protein